MWLVSELDCGRHRTNYEITLTKTKINFWWCLAKNLLRKISLRGGYGMWYGMTEVFFSYYLVFELSDLLKLLLIII